MLSKVNGTIEQEAVETGPVDKALVHEVLAGIHLLALCPAAANGLHGIADSVPQQGKVPAVSPQFTLQQFTQESGQILMEWQPGNPLLGDLF